MRTAFVFPVLIALMPVVNWAISSNTANKGRYVFSWGGRAGASAGRVISESRHQKGRAIPHVSYSREGHTSFPKFFNENFCDVAFHLFLQIKLFFSPTLI